MAIKLRIAEGFYKSRSLPLSHQECVNWYPNIPQTKGALSEAMLFGTPGIEQVAGTSFYRDSTRGAWVMEGIPYFVCGNVLYSLDTDDAEYSKTSLGTIPGSGRVSMADNGSQLMILVPGATGYIYTVEGGLHMITDSDFYANGNPQQVVFIDGYFACSTDTKKWIISALNDGMSWDALDFSSAESAPDNTVAPVVVNNQIFILGARTTEGFQNIGGSGFPFQRSGTFLDKGCVAPFSVVNTGGSYYMIGAGKDESPAVWRFAGSQYAKVSTTAVDSYIGGLDDDVVAAAFGFGYADVGAYFVGFSFRDTTLVYDQVSGLWHERRSRINDVDGYWRANAIVSAYGKTIVGDSFDGRIGILAHNIYDEYGHNIIRAFTTQVFESGSDPFALSKVDATFESGVGNAEVPDPKVSMSVSRDGRTFDFERLRAIGRVGEYGQRVIWRGIGRFPRFGYLRFRLSDPVKPVIIKVEVE